MSDDSLKNGIGQPGADRGRYRRIMEASRVGIWEWDLRTGETFISQSWIELLGFDEGSYPRGYESWMSYVHPDDRQSLHEKWEAYSHHQTPDYEQMFRFRCRDGSYRWILSRAAARSKSENSDLISGWFIDMTERYEAELAAKAAIHKIAEDLERSQTELRRQTALLNAVLEGMNEGVLLFDQSGVPVVRNRAASLFVDDEAARQPIAEWPRLFNLYHADGKKLYRRDELPAVRAMLWHEVVEDEEMCFRPPSEPSPRWFLCSSRPVQIENQRSDATLLVFHEITRLKQAEKELRDALDRVSRSNRELTHFGYVVSHDLREPLRMIYMFLELLSHRYEASLPAQAREFISLAVDGARRLNALIEDLLAYSRLVPSSAAPTADANEALDRALETTKALAQQNGAEITRENLPEVKAEPSQLALVFEHLLFNAIKFRNPAPPKIRISAERVPGEDMWHFEVQDNGIGIPGDARERIFGVFQRLHGRDEYPGSGIGLALCRKVIENHGGRIWVDSNPGQGATFSFTLPGSSPGSAATTERR